jgi:3'-phosphoadenosine 5'-phosphosulfate sulfotransferase (PAPS reductase)/FAD synthetase
MIKIKHVLGISGGKDSAALAIYLKKLYPHLDIEYYSCDTGKELGDTYKLIDNLEGYLGKSIKKLRAVEGSPEDPFDHYLQLHGGYLPSSIVRWCTKKLKLEPFEKYIAGDEPIVSYVGIRGDEDREGYISTKPNIQSIFPFRKNIWSEDVVRKALNNTNLGLIEQLYRETAENKHLLDRLLETATRPLSMSYTQPQKLEQLLNLSISDFNRVIFSFLKTTDYPLSKETDFPLLTNEDILVRDDIFKILRESGVGVPAYYDEREYYVEIDGEIKVGKYARSRSGCYFCFYQQRIEWVWLYENHRHLFEQAMTYEKDGYTWGQNESLAELAEPERRATIKREHFLKTQRDKDRKNQNKEFLIDSLGEEENEGCAACFI